MDIRQQLQRLLDLAAEMRHRIRELGTCQCEATSELDAAEYDLKRLIEEVRTLLPDGGRFAPQEPGVARRAR